jgi:signal recognition particle receptor subunit beta
MAATARRTISSPVRPSGLDDGIALRHNKPRVESRMPFINYAAKTIAIKIVYYGPGLSGKTTNLRYIYYKLDSASRGEFVSLETETDRTYFFDLLPIRAGMIGDFKVHFQLISAPGQVFYEASRKSVLRGADGIVFVADSQIPLLDANLESFDGLRRNCLQNDIDLVKIPLVFQYNKRDLGYLIPVETFNNLLNPRHAPWVEAVAINGVGVFETLREISKLTVPIVRDKLFGARPGPGPEAAGMAASPPASDGDLHRAPTGHTTRLMLKSRQEIEDELNRLSREYTGK